MKPSLTLTALASALLAAGCSVGTYNIPNVAPVVMPEPEEDMFADLDFGGGDDSSAGGEAAPPAEEPPAAEAAPAEAPAEKPAEAPAPAPAPVKQKK